MLESVRLAMLSELPTLRRISQETRFRILADAQEVRVAASQVVMPANVSLDAVYILEKGTMAECVEAPGKPDEQVVCKIPGSCFPAACLLEVPGDGAVTSTSLVAVSDCSLL